MDPDMLTQYLANILLAVTADAGVQELEGEAIKRILAETGSSLEDLDRAADYIRSGGKLAPTGRYSVRVRNLEDMLLAAMGDRGLPLEEKETILSFARMIPVTGEQLRIIAEEARERLKTEL